MKITKKAVDNLPLPTKQKKQVRYMDTVLKGFGIRVTHTGTKAFFIEKRLSDKQTRITIGQYPAITVEVARKKALQLLGDLSLGIDPLKEKQQQQIHGLTLAEVLNAYLIARKSLKPRTKKDYRDTLRIVCSDWLNKPMLNITKDKVAKRHRDYGTNHSKANANLSMRIIRALFNFAAGEYEDSHGVSPFAQNPVARLSHTRAWYHIDRRQTVIKKTQLKPWYDALENLTNPIPEQAQLLKDYLLLVLFTGLRRNEAASLTWNNIDLKEKTLTIDNPKNRQTHTLPLSDFLLNLLNRRKETSHSVFVFPAKSIAGHLNDPSKAMKQITEKSGVKFDVHTLRRTFITLAESMEIGAYTLKRLLNHKMSQDVTAGYIVLDVERLRKPMQQITDKLLYLMRTSQDQKVVPFKK